MGKFKDIRNRIFPVLVFISGIISVNIINAFRENDMESLLWYSIGLFSAVLPAVWIVFKKYNSKKTPVYQMNDYMIRKKPRIVLVGGGTGLSTLLRGIKNYADFDHENISAIVTVADDGGSSGKLRAEMSMIAPGDIRNCIVALSNEETLLSKLFNFRFRSTGDLSGHSFGNLFLAALSELNGKNFEKAVETACDILAVKGKIIPATLQSVDIGAVFEDGKKVLGESNIPYIDDGYKRISEIFIKPDNARANPLAVKALHEADAIVLGPGSLYTSIIPNLLFPSIRDAIMQSEALKIYVCNIMTQPGETDGYSLSEHVRPILRYIPESINFAIVNNGEMSYNLLEKYKDDGALPVQFDENRLKSMNIQPVMQDLVLEEDYFRHDPDKLARLIIRLVEEYKNL
ncbi:MAG: gluconeogenesis factor YvcK family protein [Candidatus Muiribacteriaceae bacterium]